MILYLFHTTEIKKEIYKHHFIQNCFEKNLIFILIIEYLSNLLLAFGKNADAEECLKIVAESVELAAAEHPKTPLKLYGLSWHSVRFRNLTIT